MPIGETTLRSRALGAGLFMATLGIILALELWWFRAV